MASVEIREETPLQDDVRALIAELNAFLEPLCPPEFRFCMTAEEMAAPNTTVFVARRDGVAIGCGALLRHDAELAEVKRMYVRQTEQGRGVGGAILERIVARAKEEGIAILKLETGDQQPAACKIYERAGFRLCPAFADYPESAYSVFYEKPLARSVAA
ncbi:GNAT family N-acetyltransferase [Aureimonas sp. AU40]|uniref:GNAT family N-acetyltransferase n=1 Tax=Aureimonas sp. AU40 TaxID=1637747 RepID=UPI0007844334|nr:GNAT family N-acetyltransferase [Aureimonas sp. AU40]